MRVIWELIATNKKGIITSQEMEGILKEQGLPSNYRTIVKSIKKINQFFEPILHKDMIVAFHHKGYKIENEFLEDGQLQFLVDSVNYNKDLSFDEKEDLIHKLTYFSSYSQKERLIKHNHDDQPSHSLMLHLSVIIKAIHQKKNIIFDYVTYDIKEGHLVEMNSSHGNYHHQYVVSPYTIVLDNNHYYLIGYFNQRKEALSMYRIDRMRKVRTYKESYIDILEQYDLDDYVKHTFGMFVNGQEIELTIHFHWQILREIVSRFGQDISVKKRDEEWYEAIIKNVNYNRGFINWVLMMGSHIKIISPASIKQDILDELTRTVELYQ